MLEHYIPLAFVFITTSIQTVADLAYAILNLWRFSPLENKSLGKVNRIALPLHTPNFSQYAAHPVRSAYGPYFFTVLLQPSWFGKAHPVEKVGR